MSKKPFKSDGCTLFPDLWFKHCCKDHDYAYWAGHDELEGDVRFLNCLVECSPRLYSFKFLFAGVIVTGMATGRHVLRLFQKIKRVLQKTEK